MFKISRELSHLILLKDYLTSELRIAIDELNIVKSELNVIYTEKIEL